MIGRRTVNELMTNALKYAFVGREGGTITVSSLVDDSGCSVIVSDDGVGLPVGASWPQSGKLSAVIAQSLRQNAKAQLEVHSVPGEGLRVVIFFARQAAEPNAVASIDGVEMFRVEGEPGLCLLHEPPAILADLHRFELWFAWWRLAPLSHHMDDLLAKSSIREGLRDNWVTGKPRPSFMTTSGDEDHRDCLHFENGTYGLDTGAWIELHIASDNVGALMSGGFNRSDLGFRNIDRREAAIAQDILDPHCNEAFVFNDECVHRIKLDGRARARCLSSVTSSG